VQGLLSLHNTAAVPLHKPPWHASPVVQLLPSSQLPVRTVCLQPPESGQLSVVHWLPSSQLGVPLPTQTPPVQASESVQKLPSLHVAPFMRLAEWTQLPSDDWQLSVVQNCPSSQPFGVPTQALALQRSLVVQALPSSQPALVAVCTQPPASGQESTVHWLLSSQLAVPLPTQPPPAQVSVNVQTLPSLHAAPFCGAGSFKHAPLDGLQVSDVQAFPSSQFVVAVATQLPSPQWSPVVHALPSLQTVTDAAAACTQPLIPLHESSLHTLLSSQLRLPLPTQLPFWQVSVVVQTLPSLQGAVVAVNTQPLAALQLSVVQGLLSVQVCCGPGMQLPPMQPSPALQALRSVQVASLARCTQPVVALHESSVQGLPSWQFWGVPGWHTPSTQVSLVVQASPSVQAPSAWLCAQPVLASQLSVVQALLSPQSMAAPDVHTAFAHASPLVQSFPSSHAPVAAACVHPAVALQPSVVQGFPSSQFAVAPGMQAPPAQASPAVHALPSEHAPVKFVTVHPELESQPSCVHTLPSSQNRAEPPVQAPFAHKSPTVQASPSSQAPAAALCAQPAAASQLSVVQGFWSSQGIWAPAAQLPPTHASPVLQTLLSEHVAALAMCTQPASASQESSVHGLPSSQPRAEPGAQMPEVQTSPSVHALPSLHAPPVDVCTQPPVASQLSSVHALPSEQFRPVPGVHTAFWHASPDEQALPSSHAPPAAVCMHPTWVLQPSVVQGLPSSQPCCAPAAHAPPSHTSSDVQTFPSEHAPPLVAVHEQPVTESQASEVQGLPSPQSRAAPPLQTPVLQTSPIVQAFWSSQAAAAALCVQPAAASQKSAVHGFESSQPTPAPGAQPPPRQASPLVQALPSVQVAALAMCTQPLAAAHESSVHTLPSAQSNAAPATHALLWQLSAIVHEFPSVQAPLASSW